MFTIGNAPSWLFSFVEYPIGRENTFEDAVREL